MFDVSVTFAFNRIHLILRLCNLVLITDLLTRAHRMPGNLNTRFREPARLSLVCPLRVPTHVMHTHIHFVLPTHAHTYTCNCTRIFVLGITSVRWRNPLTPDRSPLAPHSPFTLPSSLARTPDPDNVHDARSFARPHHASEVVLKLLHSYQWEKHLRRGMYVS